MMEILFIKLVALNYLFAFASLLVQVKGLYGSRGIAPIEELLAEIKQHYDGKLYFQIPTLFWFGCNDTLLLLLCWLGIFASAGVITGFFVAPLLAFLWMAYLSFMSVGNAFLSFQWDCLLLEVGFVAIFFSTMSSPPILLIILLWVILFKLMFSSGIVKCISGCPEWLALKALDFHYETQPLPNPVAYYMAHLPHGFSRTSLIIVFVLELAVPFMIFSPWEVRFVSFFLLVLLQILIMLTGNYAFFNTLTIALCIPLLIKIPSTIAFYTPAEWLLTGFAFIMIVLNVFVIARLFISIPIFDMLWSKIAPYYICNSYGLFARMTTKRNEIIVEGSEDGLEWKAYEFKWKPDDVRKAPWQVAPHQPRLDWQMWFAALSPYRYNQWYIAFLQRLLEGSEDVLNLLEKNPFPEKPPRFVRGQFYQYHFSSLNSKCWWTRQHEGLYSPPLSLN